MSNQAKPICWASCGRSLIGLGKDPTKDPPLNLDEMM